MKFWLGTHETSWLTKVDVPLFISRRRFEVRPPTGSRRPETAAQDVADDLTLRPWRARLPRAATAWALDSGGFTELNAFGRWVTTEEKYVEEVTRAISEIGNLAWAAPMDWMCEPFVLDKTGLTVEDHQRLTVDNYVRLSRTGLPFIPVLQGWTLADYLRCVDMYFAAGVDLTALPLVGIGSVCRRQNTGEVDLIVSTIAALGISLHGFGVKTVGLTRYADQVASADSLAWSYRARNAPALPGCTHKSCANCPRFALKWREKVLRRTGNQRLPFGAAA